MNHRHSSEVEYKLSSTGRVLRRFACSCNHSSDWEFDDDHTPEDVGLTVVNL